MSTKTLPTSSPPSMSGQLVPLEANRLTNDDGLVPKKLTWTSSAKQGPSSSANAEPSGRVSSPMIEKGSNVPFARDQRLPSRNRSLNGSAGPVDTSVASMWAEPAGAPVSSRTGTSIAKRSPENEPVAASSKFVVHEAGSANGTAPGGNASSPPPAPAESDSDTPRNSVPASPTRLSQITSTKWSVPLSARAAIELAGPSRSS